MGEVPLYSIGTWDTDLQAYTPQAGMENCINIPRDVLRTRIRALRCMGYTAHRIGNSRDGHDDNDTFVLIERTDGKPEAVILKEWER
jgi:hypothetical protein